jgi:hypothetical protein
MGGVGEAMAYKRRKDCDRRGHPRHRANAAPWCDVRHHVSTRVRRPHEVMMGVCLVMHGLMLVWRHPVMVVVCIMGCVITMRVRGTEMWQERKSPLSTSDVIEHDMHRGEEKGKNESTDECAHSVQSV